MSAGFLSDEDEIISEINMTPLVDVMLVLLIVFMITVPAIQHAVKLDLPHAASRQHDQRPAHVNLDILADGQLRWDGKPVEMSQLSQRIAQAVSQTPQPELHLYAERDTRYERVAQVMAAAQSGGLAKIGFVTEPKQP